MEIVTGHRGTPHITPYKVRDFNIGTVGAEDYVMNSGSELEAQLVSNNRIDIKDGSICMQGTHAVIPKNINDELTIENGMQGEKRIDLIVARYEKVADSGVESVNTVVLQGTPSKETPNVPGHVVGDIRNGDLKHEMPLYEVELDGINITEVRPVFKKLVSVAEQQKMIESLNGKITNGGKGYVRFPDGTQICYGTLSSTGYTSVSHNLIFAKPFIDTEYVVIMTKGINGKFITEFGEYDSAGNRNRSVDKCSVHYDATTANYTKTISWTVIGRWK